MQDSYHNRSAFLLNANAKRVNDRLLEQLIEEVPAGDVFYSKTEQDCKQYINTILNRGYKAVFAGGGDGTAMNVINTLSQAAKEQEAKRLPDLGILKLGTGNALAKFVGASHVTGDVRYLLKNTQQTSVQQDMVRCDDGTLSPFAGMGYDGEILNDYRDLCDRHENVPFKNVRESVLGYAWAGFTRLIPRRLIAEKAIIEVRSASPSYQILHRDGKDIEVEIPAGALLFQGEAPFVSVGTIPYVGYGFTMFPFALEREGYMQLRISACSLLTLLPNIYPAVWRGKFRHPLLHDFLVRDVEITSSIPLPYQVGGDGYGHREHLCFSVEKMPMRLVHFPKATKELSRFRSLFDKEQVVRAAI